MQIRLSRTAILIGASMLALHVPAMASNSTRFHDQIGIQVKSNNAALQRCADELVKRSGEIATLAPKGLRVAPIDEIHQESDRQRKAGNEFPPFIYVTDRSQLEDLISIPFVFRDAEHVLAFLRSGDFYEQIRDNPTLFSASAPRLAIAYGGFFQMFSKVAAVTETKHFYGRFIGGTVRAPDLYREFGAQLNPFSAITGMFIGLDARAAAELGQDDRFTQIVEAHLASAIENGFKGKGRFVNLVSSSMLAVEIQIWNSSVDEIGREDLKALRAWADGAAAACSEANYQKELDTLEALKADGYQIVPFNRRTLVELSWRLALENSHPYWTVEQFDRLARLGSFPRDGRLPSSLLSSMTPQKRKDALEHDNIAIFRLKEWADKRASLERQRELDRLPLESLPPPAPLSDGQRIFNRCRACHQVGETARNALGPHLNGLFGRKAGGVQGFSYSDTIRNSKIVWSETSFANFVRNPKATIPNKAFDGINDEKAVQALVQYLKQFGPDGKRK